MRKLFSQISVTLDGFMAGRIADADFDRYATETLKSIDAIFYRLKSRPPE